LVYPSQYEGFGLPLLEAMSTGCPVICSNVPALVEVAGDAGQYFDPFSVDSIRTALEYCLFDQAVLDTMSLRGICRSRLFSWASCADRTIDVYRRVVSVAS
jgi:glycosyltransferase involved in cell wall biosynthesis